MDIKKIEEMNNTYLKTISQSKENELQVVKEILLAIENSKQEAIKAVEDAKQKAMNEIEKAKIEMEAINNTKVNSQPITEVSTPVEDIKVVETPEPVATQEQVSQPVEDIKVVEAVEENKDSNGLDDELLSILKQDDVEVKKEEDTDKSQELEQWIKEIKELI